MHHQPDLLFLKRVLINNQSMSIAMMTSISMVIHTRTKTRSERWEEKQKEEEEKEGEEGEACHHQPQPPVISNRGKKKREISISIYVNFKISKKREKTEENMKNDMLVGIIRWKKSRRNRRMPRPRQRSKLIIQFIFFSLSFGFVTLPLYIQPYLLLDMN